MKKGRHKPPDLSNKEAEGGQKDKRNSGKTTSTKSVKKSDKNMPKTRAQKEEEGTTKWPPDLECLYEPSSQPTNVFEDGTDWDLGILNRMVVDFWGRNAGNRLWDYWDQTQFSMHWGEDCCSYKDNFVDPPNHKTWEEFANDWYEAVDHDDEKLNEAINNVLNYTKQADAGSPEEEEQWLKRKFLKGMAATDPDLIFGFDEPNAEGELFNRYWDKSSEYNPKMIIKERPLARIWLLTVVKLQHPWAAVEETELPSRWDDLQKEKAEHEEKVAAARALRKRQAKESPARPAGANLKKKTVTPDKDGKESTENESKEATDEMMAEPDQAKPKGTSKPNATPKLKQLRFEQYQRKAPDPPKPEYEELSSEDSSEQSELEDDYQPESYLEAAKLPEAVRTTEQKVQQLVQVDMRGMPFKHVAIFSFKAAIEWQGAELEQMEQDRTDRNVKVRIDKRLLMVIRKAFREAMDESDFKLTLLPIADGEYKRRKEWIRNSVELEEKLTSWEKLKGKVETGGRSNFNWVCKHAQNAHTRSLYSRFRVGFNAPPDVAMSLLNASFEANASGGVFPSKLQYGSVTWPGYIPYYSLMADPDAIARQLMMLFDYKIPIAVEPTWPSAIQSDINPANTATTWKYGENEQFLHVCTPTAFAKKVDAELARKLSLDKSVLKNQYPWGSPAQYLHDVKLARYGKLSVQWDPSVEKVMLRQVDTAKAFLHVSESYMCPIRLPGMCTLVSLSNFGEDDGTGRGLNKPVSLLKVLWSIKCIPAKKTKKKVESEEISDGFTEETSELTGDSKELSATSGARMMTPQERRMREKVMAKLTAQDEARNWASALFTHIMPAKEKGFWIFSFRKKYSSVARNVLDELVAFLTFYLEEPTVTQENSIFRKWMDFEAVRRSRTNGMVWYPPEHRARSELDDAQMNNLDLGLSFLQGLQLVERKDEVFEGAVVLDMEMADVKAIDEGATIKEILEEARKFREAQQQLAAAKTEAQEARDQAAAAIKRNRELEAQLAELKGMQIDVPEESEDKVAHGDVGKPTPKGADDQRNPRKPRNRKKNAAKARMATSGAPSAGSP